MVRTSCGTEGFRNVKKSTPVAAQAAGISAAAVRSHLLHVTLVTYCERSVLYVLHRSSLTLTSRPPCYPSRTGFSLKEMTISEGHILLFHSV